MVVNGPCNKTQTEPHSNCVYLKQDGDAVVKELKNHPSQTGNRNKRKSKSKVRQNIQFCCKKHVHVHLTSASDNISHVGYLHPYLVPPPSKTLKKQVGGGGSAHSASSVPTTGDGKATKKKKKVVTSSHLG